jgi:hypothetical protein
MREWGTHGTPWTVIIGIRVGGVSAVVAAVLYARRGHAILETVVAVGDAVESVWGGWWALDGLWIIAAVVVGGGLVLVLFFLAEETHVGKGRLCGIRCVEREKKYLARREGMERMSETEWARMKGRSGWRRKSRWE